MLPRDEHPEHHYNTVVSLIGAEIAADDGNRAILDPGNQMQPVVVRKPSPPVFIRPGQRLLIRGGKHCRFRSQRLQANRSQIPPVSRAEDDNRYAFLHLPILSMSVARHMLDSL